MFKLFFSRHCGGGPSGKAPREIWFRNAANHAGHRDLAQQPRQITGGTATLLSKPHKLRGGTAALLSNPRKARGPPSLGAAPPPETDSASANRWTHDRRPPGWTAGLPGCRVAELPWRWVACVPGCRIAWLLGCRGVALPGCSVVGLPSVGLPDCRAASRG